MAKFSTGHIGLNVSNLESSKDFYQRIFDFQAVYESADTDRAFVFLGDGSRLVLTLWQQSDGRFSPKTPGLHHLSFQVEAIEEVLAMERNLREQGVPIIYDGIVPHREGQSSAALFFEDPDGIRLEVFTQAGGEDFHAPHQDAPSCGFF